MLTDIYLAKILFEAVDREFTQAVILIPRNASPRLRQIFTLNISVSLPKDWNSPEMIVFVL